MRNVFVQWSPCWDRKCELTQPSLHGSIETHFIRRESCSFHIIINRLGGVVAERPSRLWGFCDSWPGHIKIFINASNGFPSLVVGLSIKLTRWCQDKRSSSTGKLYRKRRDITEILLNAALNIIQTNEMIIMSCFITPS